jgi:predicted transposase YbfD/YdcC
MVLIITIDAMGCQRAITQKLIEKKADHVFGLKRNQGSLRDDVDLFIAEQKAKDFADTTISRAETIDADNGHIEARTTTVIHQIDWLRKRHRRPGLNAIAMVESTRERKGVIESGFSSPLWSCWRTSSGPSYAVIGRSKTARTGSWTWSFATMNAGSEPIMLPLISRLSNIWPTTCFEGRPARIHSASDERSRGGTMSSS